VEHQHVAVGELDGKNLERNPVLVRTEKEDPIALAGRRWGWIYLILSDTSTIVKLAQAFPIPWCPT
jgi:hypothetical protein